MVMEPWILMFVFNALIDCSLLQQYAFVNLSFLFVLQSKAHMDFHSLLLAQALAWSGCAQLHYIIYWGERSEAPHVCYIWDFLHIIIIMDVRPTDLIQHTCACAMLSKIEEELLPIAS